MDLTSQSTVEINRIKGTSSSKYRVAEELDLKAALRSGDGLAGAELLRRQRTNQTDLDRLQRQKSQKEDDKLYNELKSMNDEMDKLLHA